MKSCIVSVLGKKYSIRSYKSLSDIPINSSDLSIFPHPDFDFELISSKFVGNSPLGALRAVGEYVFHSLGYPRTELEILAFGGTDTSSIQMTASGCRAGAISIPSRYIHSGVEMIDMNDYKACIELALEFIKE